MSNNSWLNNSRGEWYVIGQAVFILVALLTPMLDSQRVSWFGGANVVGSLLAVIGLGFVVLGSIALGRNNLSPFPKPRDNATLITSGIFSIVRHPIYSGFIFLALGWSWIWSSVATFVAALALLIFLILKQDEKSAGLRRSSATTPHTNRERRS